MEQNESEVSVYRELLDKVLHHAAFVHGDVTVLTAGDPLLKEIRDALNAKPESSGDIPSMRKALEEIDKDTELLDIPEDMDPELHPSHSFVAVKIRKAIRDALSKPPRNCDVLFSEKEARDAWEEYRRRNPVPRGGWDFRHVIQWLYARVKEEGETKP